MIQAYAAKEAGGPLEPFSYDPGDLGSHEVEIGVEHCGICHSDLSMIQNDWGISAFPLVAGHEVAGKITAVGEHVKHLRVGDRVGLGWHKGYCNHCPQCLQGDHNLCRQAQASIVGQHGGFADKVRAHETSVVSLPEALPFSKAGPLMCGGITVFNPFVQYEVSPLARVGVVGIGGLGHLAIQFARAWGCEVTAFTSESKMEEARGLGAHHCYNSRDSGALKQATGSLDLILSTVNVQLDWMGLLNTLAPKGRLHLLGAVLEPMQLGVFPILMNQLSISASPVGSPATLGKMLEFAARHGIHPVTEHFPMSRVNEALAHLASGQARYRVVLDRD